MALKEPSHRSGLGSALGLSNPANAKASPALAFPQRIRTFSLFHRAILAFGVPMFFLGTWAVFSRFSETAERFLHSGDMPRYWLNEITAYAAALGCLTMVGVNLHLLTKRVTVIEEGIQFTGFFRRFVRWSDIAEARIEAEKHTTSLLLRSTDGKRHEIGIGDREAAAICATIVAAVAKRQP